MRNRNRQDVRGRSSAVVGVVSNYPRETLAILAGIASIMTIFINALFMQQGPHPAPIFASSSRSTGVAALPPQSPQAPPLRQMGTVPIRPAEFEPAIKQPFQSAAKAAPAPVRTDPIADLITAPPKRLVAVQRVLSEYGYGQIKANGEFGPETEQAIAKFERDHKMPVTGQMSDRLVKALALMTGRSFE